jgi:hypothetical protein
MSAFSMLCRQILASKDKADSKVILNDSLMIQQSKSQNKKSFDEKTKNFQ